LQEISDTNLGSEGEQQETGAEAQKRLISELRAQWKLLWDERFDDKIRAEGVSINDYKLLHVDQGTIIQATKNFKAPDFKDILKNNMVANPERYIQPNVNIGGWNKFIKTEMKNCKPGSKNSSNLPEKIPKKIQNQQTKKGGRGWLHTT
jgi:hypothetical protein